MKTIALSLMAVLLIGMFATTFVLAEESELVEVSELAESGITEDEVNSALSDVAPSASNDKARIGFVEVTKGNGWIENGEIGFLIHGFWASQLVYNDTAESDPDPSRPVRYGGVIHIASVGSYKLSKLSPSENDVSFSLTPANNDRHNLGMGVLNLNKVSEYGGIIIWEGDLTIKNGPDKLNGEWNVHLATDKRRMNPGEFRAAQNPGKKIGFWNKLAFWKRARENPSTNIKESNGIKACTKDAKVCSDGSTVSRNSSNNCKFDPCPKPNAKLSPNAKVVAKQQQQARVYQKEPDFYNNE